MLKRISIEQLSLGMHVHEFCGSWMDHPFWRGAFLLDNPNDLQTILSTGIKEAWIDTSKGLDVEGDEAEDVIAAEVEAMLAQADTIEKKQLRALIFIKRLRVPSRFAPSPNRLSPQCFRKHAWAKLWMPKTRCLSLKKFPPR